MSVMQDLYDSEINVKLMSRWDIGWKVRLGDTEEDALEFMVDTWQELEDWLVKEAIARYPNSEFAAKYRRRLWQRRPHLTLVDGGVAH